MTAIFTLPRQQPVAGDIVLSSGQIALRAYPAAKLEFYQANTLTPVDVYSNAARSTPHPWPVIADSTGKFPVIYLPADVTLDVVLKTSNGATIDTYEDVPGDSAIGSGNVSEIGRGLEVGAIVWHSLQEVPAGWLRIKRDPQALSKSEYPELNSKYSSFGYPYGSTSTTFNIPGGAGLFPRIWDDTSTHDPNAAARLDHATALSTVGNLIGSRQLNQNKSHLHAKGTIEVTVNAGGGHAHGLDLRTQGAGASHTGLNTPPMSDSGSSDGGDATTKSEPAHTHTTSVSGSTASEGGDEARPVNVAFPLIILVNPAAAAANHSSLGMPYRFATDTTDTDPGAGVVKLNHADPGSATLAYVSKSDAFGAGVGDLWATINEVTGSRRAVLTVYNTLALANSVTAIVTGALVDASAYWKVPVSVKSSNGALVNEAYLSIQFALSGPSATQGELGEYTVAELAAVTEGPNAAIATDGRKNGEGSGSGTGVLAFRIGSSWFACDTGAALAS